MTETHDLDKEYDNQLRKLQIDDLVHADTFNPLFEQLINNDDKLHGMIEGGEGEIPDIAGLDEELWPHNDAYAIIKWQGEYKKARIGNIRQKQGYLDYLRGAHVEIPEIPEVEFTPDIYYVAASNAPDSVKERAHYVCTGQADDVTIMQAMTAIHEGIGGTIILSPGTYDIVNPISVRTRCKLSGSGLRTRLILNRTNNLGSNTPIVYVDSYGTLEHLYINGGDGWSEPGIYNVGIRTSNYATVQFCEIEEVQKYCLNDWKGTNTKILYNIIHHTQYPFALSGDTQKMSEGALIHGNAVYSYGLHCKARFARDYRVTNNLFLHDMANQEGWRFSGGDGPNVNGVVDGNIFVDREGSGWQVAIRGTQDSGGLTTNNMISNNTIIGFDRGILIDGGSGGGHRYFVQGNTINGSRWAGIEECGVQNYIHNNFLYKAGIIVRNSTGAIIKNNRIIDATGHWTTASSGIFLRGQHSTVSGTYILDNVISDCGGHGIYISNMDEGVEDTFVLRNVMFNNTGDNINDEGTNTYIRDNLGWVVPEDIKTVAREGGRNIWVQSEEPTAIEEGDLWFEIEEEAEP